MIDPCAGSGSTLRAAYELNRNSYGFEIDRKFFEKAKKMIEPLVNLKEEQTRIMGV